IRWGSRASSRSGTSSRIARGPTPLAFLLRIRSTPAVMASPSVPQCFKTVLARIFRHLAIKFYASRRLAPVHSRSIPQGSTGRVVRTLLNVAPGDKILQLAIDGFTRETNSFPNQLLSETTPAVLIGMATDKID